MTFPITSSRFFGFLMKITIFSAKIQKNHDFRQRNWTFQIDEKVSDSWKNQDFVKFEFGIIFFVKSSAKQPPIIRKKSQGVRKIRKICFSQIRFFLTVNPGYFEKGSFKECPISRNWFLENQKMAQMSTPIKKKNGRQLFCSFYQKLPIYHSNNFRYSDLTSPSWA